MATNTQRLNLIQPAVDDDIQQTIVSLANNFKIMDDNFDEFTSNIETFLTSGRVYDSGKKFWNRIPVIGGFAGWVNVRTGVFAPKWRKQATYNVGDKVTPQKNEGRYYECIVGGTSGATEPAFPLTDGGTIYDLYGHTVWTPSYNYSLDDIVVSTVGDRSYYYKCVLAGTSGVAEPSWRNTAGSTNLDGSCQWYVFKTAIWQEKGVSSEFLPFGSVGDYKGVDTIQTVGTITKGKWEGEKIGVPYGGTGGSTALEARANLKATGKYAETIGDGTKKSFTIPHNLNTQDVIVTIRETSAQANIVEAASIKAPDVNGIIVEFATAPQTGQYRVIVIG